MSEMQLEKAKQQQENLRAAIRADFRDEIKCQIKDQQTQIRADFRNEIEPIKMQQSEIKDSVASLTIQSSHFCWFLMMFFDQCRSR